MLISSREAGVLSMSRTAMRMLVTSVVRAKAMMVIWITGTPKITTRIRGSRSICRNSLTSIRRIRCSIAYSSLNLNLRLAWMIMNSE